MIQDDGSISNGNRDTLPFDGMADVEVERRLKVVKMIHLYVTFSGFTKLSK